MHSGGKDDSVLARRRELVKSQAIRGKMKKHVELSSHASHALNGIVIHIDALAIRNQVAGGQLAALDILLVWVSRLYATNARV
jgi:hypothetical protein